MPQVARVKQAVDRVVKLLREAHLQIDSIKPQRPVNDIAAAESLVSELDSQLWTASQLGMEQLSSSSLCLRMLTERDSTGMFLLHAELCAIPRSQVAAGNEHKGAMQAEEAAKGGENSAARELVRVKGQLDSLQSTVQAAGVKLAGYADAIRSQTAAKAAFGRQGIQSFVVEGLLSELQVCHACITASTRLIMLVLCKHTRSSV